MTELRNSIESFNKRLNQAEKRVNELEDRLFETIQSEEEKEKEQEKSEETLWNVWDTIKWNNIFIMGIPERNE